MVLGRSEVCLQLERLFHPMMTPIVQPREDRNLVIGRIRRHRGGDGYQYQMSDHLSCSSDYVSRRHCEIFFRDGVYKIQDLGSSNGTFLNHQQLLPFTEMTLGINDVLGLGITQSSLQARSEICFLFRLKNVPSTSLDLLQHHEFRTRITSTFPTTILRFQAEE